MVNCGGVTSYPCKTVTTDVGNCGGVTSYPCKTVTTDVDNCSGVTLHPYAKHLPYLMGNCIDIYPDLSINLGSINISMLILIAGNTPYIIYVYIYNVVFELRNVMPRAC